MMTHLTEREVEKLIEVTKGNRHEARDSTMILIGFRHGLVLSRRYAEPAFAVPRDSH